MAKIIRRERTSKEAVGKRVRHVTFGYTRAINIQRERKVSSAWTCEGDALKALSERQQQIRAGQRWRSATSSSRPIMGNTRCTRTSVFWKNNYSQPSGPGC